jgi:hypothetical protein
MRAAEAGTPADVRIRKGETVKKIIGGIGEILIYVLIFGLTITLLNLHFIYLTSF